jgi:hypothetical protein
VVISTVRATPSAFGLLQAGCPAAMAAGRCGASAGAATGVGRSDWPLVGAGAGAAATGAGAGAGANVGAAAGASEGAGASGGAFWADTGPRINNDADIANANAAALRIMTSKSTE